MSVRYSKNQVEVDGVTYKTNNKFLGLLNATGAVVVSLLSNRAWLIVLLTLGALVIARHLNTVPRREWDGGYKFHSTSVRTVESLFGSTYRAYDSLGKDTGLSSKHFEDLVSSMENNWPSRK